MLVQSKHVVTCANAFDKQGAWIDGGEVGTKVAKCVKGKCPKQPYYPEILLTDEKPKFVKRQEWI